MEYSKHIQSGILRANAKLLKDAEREQYMSATSTLFQDKLERVQRLGLMGVPSRYALDNLLYSFQNHEHGARDRIAEINMACKRILGDEYGTRSADPIRDFEYRDMLLEICRDAYRLGAYTGDGMKAKMLLSFHRVKKAGNK